MANIIAFPAQTGDIDVMTTNGLASTETVAPDMVTGITFDNRKSPTELAGTDIRGSMNVKQALSASGLDWMVEQHVLTDAMTGNLVPGFKVNVRDVDNKVLGVVSDRYRICQNREAFDFVDDIVSGGNVKLETAGMAKGGQRVWMEAALPEMDILGEPSSPYILFINSHDGTGAVRVCFTTVRVWCKNMLSFATKHSRRSFSILHKGDIEAKIEEAKRTLAGADIYFKELSDEIDRLAAIKMGDGDIVTAINALFPIDESMSNLKALRAKENRYELLYRYRNADDLSNIRGTAYGFISAVSDFASHSIPHRMTTSYYENNLMKLITGNSIVDKAYDIIKAA